jgi:large subunit ribosomal protein LP0
LICEKVLDLTENDLLDKFAAVSLALGYPTLAAVPHNFVNAHKNLLAIAVETEYSFPLAEKTKDYLKDPSKFAASAALIASDSAAAPEAAKVVEKVKEGASKELNTASDMVKDAPGKTKETAQNLKEVGVEAAKAVLR